MAIHQHRQYLITYDIADPKRLQRTHRVLKKQGLPVQYSVFSVLLTRPALKHLLEGIAQIIDEREDDLRCYSLPTFMDCKTLGIQNFPEGVMLYSKGVSRLLK